MRITSEIAIPIVKQLIPLLSYNINIMDESGVIVASGDPNRLGERHEGAIQVINSKKDIIITSLNKNQFPGTKEGVNLPIQCNNNIVGVVGITGQPEDAGKVARITKLSVEVLLQQMYTNNQFHFRLYAMENWLLELTNPHIFDEIKLSTIAESLEIDYKIERIVMLVKINEPDISKEIVKSRHSLMDMKKAIFNHLKKLSESVDLYAFLGNGLVFLSYPSSGVSKKMIRDFAKKIENELQKINIKTQIGIGSSGAGIGSYRKSYFQAKCSIELLRKFASNQQVAMIEDWGAIALLKNLSQQECEDFIERYMPECTNFDEDLEYTLSTFLNLGMHIKKTANELHIHHNTLIYRLDKINQLLNLDPRHFNDAVLLNLLLICRRLTQCR